MKTYEDLELRYTSEETDNSKIWACSLSWTRTEIDINFGEYDSASKMKILKYLTDPAYVAEGLNLIVN
jgi:hypothetical protein